MAQEMFQNEYSIGGEQSGHIIISDYAHTGDGILTALILMSIMVEKSGVSSSMSAGFVSFPQKIINVPVRDKNRIMKEPEVLALIDNCNKELGDNGRVLLRASGTEPLIRIMVEAESIDVCEKYIELLKDVVERVSVP